MEFINLLSDVFMFWFVNDCLYQTESTQRIHVKVNMWQW